MLTTNDWKHSNVRNEIGRVLEDHLMQKEDEKLTDNTNIHEEQISALKE